MPLQRKFVGDFWLGKLAERVIQGGFDAFVGAETVDQLDMSKVGSTVQSKPAPSQQLTNSRRLGDLQ
jgi:hypothetical protein